MGHDQEGTVVVLTALEVEYRAARAHLTALTDRAHHTGTLFEVGWLNGTPWRIVLAEIGDGNQGAAVLTERLISLFHPRAVFLVGVAGSLKPDDVRLGDVVVATYVHPYHSGKEENGEFLARPRSLPAPHTLTQLAKSVRMKGSWIDPLPEPPDGAGPPSVHLKPIATGEIVLNSPSSPLKQQLRRNYQDAVAIEMESAGVAHAAHLNKALPALTVRGISDRADGAKYAADAAGWQTVAARNAASFAFSVIRRLPYDEDGLPQWLPAASPAPSAIRIHVPESLPPCSGTAGADFGAWRGGAEIAVGEREYLLHDALLEERSSSDHSLIERQALAVQLSPPTGRDSRYVWLRQAEARSGTGSARERVKALDRERDLLAGPLRRVSGLPHPDLFAPGGHTATLALAWPTSHANRMPCETLHTACGHTGEPLDSWRLHRLLTGLSGLCGTLAKLHGHGVTHRCLAPSGVIALDGGSLVLRDLGLAARAPEPGEGPEAYQAPEQRRRGERRRPPGTWTDVYQLGATIYHLVAGHPPGHREPLPLRTHAPDVPESVDRTVRAALAADPAERPDIRAFGAMLRGARDDLSQER